jgi:pilus assembly protein CpaE
MSGHAVVAVGTPQSFRQILARALEAEPEDVGWVQSCTAAEELLIGTNDPAHVLVVSPEVKEADAFGLAEFVSRSAPSTAVLMVREQPMNGLLPAAMRSGIRDVVDLRHGADDLRDALERAIAWADNVRSNAQTLRTPSQRGTVIAIFSSKGGSGKTFLTTNLASALADMSGKDVAVADLDIDMGDVFAYFGSEPNATMEALMQLGDAPREVILQTGRKVDDHLWAFGAPANPTQEPPPGEQVGKFLRALRNEFAYVVVDASVEYSDAALVCFDLADTICLITPLDVVGVKHLSKALDTLLAIGVPRERFRVVLNRADSKVGLEATDVERVMKIEVDTMIPSSRLVPTSLNKGRPVVLAEPTAEVSTAIRGFAARFIKGREDGVVMESQATAEGNGRKKKGLFAR